MSIQCTCAIRCLWCLGRERRGGEVEREAFTRDAGDNGVIWWIQLSVQMTEVI